MTIDTFATEHERIAYARGIDDALSLWTTSADSLRATLAAQRQAGPVTMARLAEAVARTDPARLRVLRPFDRAEAITVKEAAGRAAVSETAMRAWCTRYAIGRRRVGSLLVSAPALAMLLEDDVPALAAYLSGDRAGPLVVGYLALK